jgi:outer membrane receptor for ferric coprogen and ferric-rhodotorulic acid
MHSVKTLPAMASKARPERAAWLFLLLLATAGPTTVASAQGGTPTQDETKHHFDIGPGTLDQVINRFAGAARIELAVDSAMTRDKTSPGLTGDVSVVDGLRQILRGQHLSAERQPDGTYRLHDTHLSKISVTASSDPTAARLNPPTSVGSKTPLSAREVPESLTVVPQEQIEQQNMNTLNDAMRYIPGISVGQSDSERTNYYARGFPIDTWLLDGVPTTQNLASIAPNLAMFDHVEVLRGADGLTNGFGSGGGAINLVRKRAPDSFTLKTELFGGNYSTYGGQVDVGGPLDASDNWRGRVVARLQSADLIEDSTWRRDKLFYATIGTSLIPDTTVNFGGSYNETRQKAMWTGVPTSADYSFLDLPRSTYLGAAWNNNRYDITTAFADLKTTLAGEWSTHLAFNHLQNRSNILNGNVSGPVDAALNDATLGSTRWNQNDRQDSVDFNIAGPISLFGRSHLITVGGSYEHENLRVINFYCSGDNPFCQSTGSIFAVIPQPAFDGPVSDETTATDQYGLYANARLSLADRLTMIVGSRVTWWDSNFTPNPDANYFGDADKSNRISGRTTPYAGLIYDINSDYSLYASYTDIFVPQSTYDVSGALLNPLQGEQYEAGIKAEYLDGKVNAGFALFQLTEKNRAVTDPRFPGEGFSVAQGRARSRGLELTSTGELLPGWTVFGGYTLTEARYLDSSTNIDGVGF